MAHTLASLAAQVQGTVVGDENLSISVLSPINDIASGALVFADGGQNIKLAEASGAAALLVSKQVTSEHKALIQVDNPLKAFIQLLTFFHPPVPLTPGIHPSAVIAEDAVLGEDCSVGAFAYVGAGSVIGAGCVIKNHASIGEQVKLGEGCVIHPHVSIYDRTELGDRVVIHANTVIGSDGFGYTVIDGQQAKMPHVGRVRIESDVEIGANSAVDRATLGETVIGAGSKVDNFVQIAHSVKLGPQNIVCAFTGIAGSTTSGKGVIFAANVGVSDHVKIDDGVVLGARAGVPSNKHLKQGNVYLGNPARPKEKAIETELCMTRFPYLRRQVHALQEKVEALVSQAAAQDEK